MSSGAPIEIAFWLGQHRRVPDAATIVSTWHVSRATAYRWRRFALAGGRSQHASRARCENRRWEVRDDT